MVWPGHRTIDSELKKASPAHCSLLTAHCSRLTAHCSLVLSGVDAEKRAGVGFGDHLCCPFCVEISIFGRYYLHKSEMIAMIQDGSAWNRAGIKPDSCDPGIFSVFMAV